MDTDGQSAEGRDPIGGGAESTAPKGCSSPHAPDHRACTRIIELYRGLGRNQSSRRIDYGHFLSKTVSCYTCGRQWAQNEEKKTDVNIAVRMLDDAYDDRFDTAIVISGDSDLTVPIQAVQRRFHRKRVLVAFPPKRFSKELDRVADHAFEIFARNIRASRLPPSVTTSDGTTLTAPQGWLPAAHQNP